MNQFRADVLCTFIVLSMISFQFGVMQVVFKLTKDLPMERGFVGAGLLFLLFITGSVIVAGYSK